MGAFAGKAKTALCVCKKGRQRGIPKKNKSRLARLPLRFKVAVHDESIFIYDVKIRKVWVIKGSKPIVLATGSHRKVVVSGIICEDDSQLFRTYKSADSDSFLNLLKCTLRKYDYLALFVDKAKWHREKRVRRFMRKNRHRLKIFWFPSGHPELNPMEECWRQGKDDILGSMFFDNFNDFQKAVRSYYRTKRFKLDLYKYLCH